MNALVNKVLRKTFPRGVNIPACDLAEVLDSIFELQRLADAETSRTPAEQLTAAAALDLPADVGGVKLWRLSMAACEWLAQVERDWFAADHRMMDMAVVWACSHAREPAAFKALGGRTATAFKVAFWARMQGAAWEALTATVKALLPKQSAPAAAPGVDPAPVDDDGGAYLGTVLDALLTNYGQTVDHWLWEVSQDVVSGLLARIAERNDDGETVGPRRIAAHAEFVKAARAFDAKWGNHA